jgi:hypothetical protein
VNLQEVVLSSSSSQLSHGLNEWGTLNVTNGTSQLDDTHIWSLVGIVNRDSGHSLDPVLDGVCKMWDNLNSSSQVVTSTLLLDDVLVDLSGGDVVLAGESDVQVTFIVTQIQIDLATVVEDKALSVPRKTSISLPGLSVYVLRTLSEPWFQHRRSCMDRP